MSSAAEMAHGNPGSSPVHEAASPDNCGMTVSLACALAGGRAHPFKWRWEKEDRASLRDPEDSAAVSSKASRI